MNVCKLPRKREPTEFPNSKTNGMSRGSVTLPPLENKIIKKKKKSVCLSPAKLDEGWGESEEARDGTMGKRQNSK